LATAAANWAVRRASERLERERTARRSDGAAFAVMISGSALDEETVEHRAVMHSPRLLRWASLPESRDGSAIPSEDL